MGPRSFDRGEHAVRLGVCIVENALQWGRGHLTAERAILELATDCILDLQWGRGHLTAERK